MFYHPVPFSQNSEDQIDFKLSSLQPWIKHQKPPLASDLSQNKWKRSHYINNWEQVSTWWNSFYLSAHIFIDIKPNVVAGKAARLRLVVMSSHAAASWVITWMLVVLLPRAGRETTEPWLSRASSERNDSIWRHFQGNIWRNAENLFDRFLELVQHFCDSMNWGLLVLWGINIQFILSDMT